MLPKTLITAAAAALLLAGCQSAPKETAGTVGGAIIGGVIGSQFGGGTGQLVATGVGTLLGAYIGKEVGASLDRADQNYANQAAQRAYAAPVGQQIAWNNPQSGHTGTITTTRDGYSNRGEYCREYQQTVTVGGRTEMAFGTACKQPDGTWKIMN